MTMSYLISGKVSNLHVRSMMQQEKNLCCVSHIDSSENVWQSLSYATFGDADVIHILIFLVTIISGNYAGLIDKHANK